MKILVQFLLKSTLLIFALGYCEKAALCQTIDAYNLKGIHSVSVSIDETPGDPCGISEEDIKTSVKFIVGQSALHIAEKSSFFVYANIAVTNDCTASNVSVQVLTPVTVDGTAAWDPDATIWQESSLLTGPNQRTRILEEVEALCKELVVDWNSVNSSH